ncbi:MAG: hypothetical protein K1X35_08585 [Caulobacteraceae bacterium]|nr:hypothetical protein [Caulobacteraceae bacterium]
MSRHNIVGSEAFDRSPFVYIRNVNSRARLRPRGLAVTAALGAAALGAVGLIAFAVVQAIHVFF